MAAIVKHSRINLCIPSTKTF